jgi:chaperonin cofactor prefoldin
MEEETSEILTISQELNPYTVPKDQVKVVLNELAKAKKEVEKRRKETNKRLNEALTEKEDRRKVKLIGDLHEKRRNLKEEVDELEREEKWIEQAIPSYEEKERKAEEEWDPNLLRSSQITK